MIIRGEPIEQYHAHWAVSKSGALDFEQSPRAFYEKWVAGMIARTSSRAQDEGSLTDLLVTEGEDVFSRSVAVEMEADPNRRTKAYQEWKAEQEAAGKRIVSQDYLLTLRDQVEAIRDVPEAVEVIGLSESQVTLRAVEPDSGLLIQSRPDFLALEGPARFDGGAPVSVDLKTTSDLARFERYDIMGYGYHVQQAFVRLAMAGLDVPVHLTRHAVLVVTKQRPCVARLIWLDRELVLCAMAEARHLLCRLRDCAERGEWPRTLDAVRSFQLPTYYAATWNGEVTHEESMPF